MNDHDKTKQQLIDELVESRRCIDTLMNTLPEGILIVDAPNVTIRMASRYGRQMIGATWEEIEGVEGVDHFRFYRMYHCDGTEAQVERLPLARALFRGEVIQSEEWLLELRDGRRFPVLCHAGPVREQDGAITGAVVSWQDITEHKRAEEESARNKAMLRAVIECLPFDVFAVGEDGRYQLENAVCREHWGRLVGKTPEEMAPSGAMRELWLDNNRRAFSGEKVADLVTVTIQGEERFVYNLITPIQDESRSYGIVGVNVDITERKRAEEALKSAHDELERRVEQRTAELTKVNEQLKREVEDRKRAEEALRHSHDELRAMYDGMVDGLLISDIKTNRFVRANASICRMLGYSEAELLSLSVTDIHPAEALPDILKQIGSIEEVGRTPAKDIPIVCKDGSVFHVEAIGKLVVYNGSPCLMGMFRDITERRRAQESLQRERRTLEHLLRSSDHERQLIAYEIHDGLAQYLAGSIMQLQMADHLRRDTPGEASKAFDAGLAMVRESLNEARRLISGVRPPILDDSGVVAAVAHLVCEFKALKGPKIDFRSKVEFGRLAPILENAIYRITQEGLTNAWKHSKSKTVSVGLVQRAGHVRIVIQDHGIGFDMKTVEDGRFGLEGIRERARLLGGRSLIESTAGEGTRIVVELPIVLRKEDEE